jgi:membrane protease YdiL (CAAX protease family)
VLLAGLTALSEELWFRGVLFRSLSGAFPFGASCVLQAAAFAVAHVAKGVSAPVFLVLASFAVAAAWLLHRTRSLGPPVALHFAANLVLIGASYGTLPMPGG